MVEDEKIWLIEFYSPMCGSCQEFSPIWKDLEDSLRGKISCGKVNIDDKEGLRIAQSVGALDEGIPHLRLFHKVKDSKGISLNLGMVLDIVRSILYKPASMADEAQMNRRDITKALKKIVKGILYLL